MAIKTSVSEDFLSTFVDSINFFHCPLPGVIFKLTWTTFDSLPAGC